MIAVDSSVLVDVLAARPPLRRRSEASLGRALAEGPVVVCDVVVAEIDTAARAARRRPWRRWPTLGIRYLPTSEPRGGARRRHAAALSRPRRAPRAACVADFLIGAHALLQCDALITRDDGFFRDYFKGLQVIVPQGPLSTGPARTQHFRGSRHVTRLRLHPPDLQDRLRQGGLVLLAAGPGEAVPEHLAPADLDPHRARVGAAQLRRQEGHCRSTWSRSPAGSRTRARLDEVPFVVARVVLQDFTGVPLLADLAAMRNVAARDGQGREDDRAAGAGRPGGRPLGDDRLLRHEEGARPEHEAGVHAQRRALPVHEVGHAGLRHLRRRAAGLRHRPPGQPRVPGARRLQDRGDEGRAAGLLPRLAGRHRQPHDHDQRHRRGRLGRRRHRGRGGDARPAGLLPDARRGRLRVHRARCAKASPPPTWCSPSPRSCASRRWSASSSSSSARASAGLAVPDRATIANMAPEYGATMGFFPVDDKTIEYFEGTGRTEAGDRGLPGLLQGAGHVRHAARRRRSTTRRSSASTWARSRPAWPARSGRRTGSSSATSRSSSPRSSPSRRPRTASTSRRRSC